MPVVALAHETDFEGWRRAARGLRAAGAPPDTVVWQVGRGLGFERPEAVGGTAAFSVPKDFIDLAQKVALNRSPARWDLLYRLLWRLADNPNLLRIASDADVVAAYDMAKAVSRASHKMKAFVRFREVEGEAEETFVAWFEPAHRVTEYTAPFFVRRFTSLRFSILTPDACAHWDGGRLTFTPGADRSQAPDDDRLEALWRTYYGSIFNPARLKVGAMTKEMPKRYWRNLPEASLIPALVADAEARMTTMVASEPTRPHAATAAKARRAHAQVRAPISSPEDGVVPADLPDIAKLIQTCRRCDLWANATQGVPGEGPAQARLMIVGEQPGDSEDLSGRPFVGPAGQLFDRALAQAGAPRDEIYVTNAVKHFKNEPRGKRRLHKTPEAPEIDACRWWLDHERRLVRPRVVLAMGATAARSVFGRAVPIMKSRGEVFQLPDQSQGMVTMHPSFLLRVPDERAKAEGFENFVADLRAAWRMVKG